MAETIKSKDLDKVKPSGLNAPVQPGQPKGTGFVNVGKYLGANIGSGQRLGQAVGSQVQQAGQQLQQQAQQQGLDIRAKAEQQRLSQQDKDLFQSYLDNPTQYTETNPQYNQLQTILNKVYQTPQIQNQQELQAQSQNLLQQQQLASNPQMRWQLMNQYMPRNARVGQGLNQLALRQADPTLRQSAQKAMESQIQANQEIEGAKALSAQRQNELENFQKYMREQVGQKASDIETQATSPIKSDQETWAEQVNALAGSGTGATAEQYDTLMNQGLREGWITSDQYGRYMNPDAAFKRAYLTGKANLAGNLIQYVPSTETLSPEKKAQINALNKFLGQSEKYSSLEPEQQTFTNQILDPSSYSQYSQQQYFAPHLEQMDADINNAYRILNDVEHGKLDEAKTEGTGNLMDYWRNKLNSLILKKAKFKQEQGL